MKSSAMALDRSAADRAPAAGDAQFDIVLKPVSHPGLGDILISENLFAIGRGEPPFDSYASDVVGNMSRRHARIFSEHGAVYVVDLGSKNGTTVNGRDIRQQVGVLKEGDELSLGGTLSYRVHLEPRPPASAVTERLSSLTLSPERADSGLLPVVITQFPFLISKADPTFARYKGDCQAEYEYLSRRHAHIFLKGGAPYIEDLSSTNGTFLNGDRLDERAVALQDGDVLAFGGRHFVFRVSVQKEEVAADPTLTQFIASRPRVEKEAEEKTLFVAAPDSFLDIFCVEQPQPDDKPDAQAGPPGQAAPGEADKHRGRGKAAVFLSEMHKAIASDDRRKAGRRYAWGAGLAGLLAAVAIVAYLSGAAERNLNDLLASGQYARASVLAERHLEQDPDNAQLQALATEALLKADLPAWMQKLGARDFDGAAALLAQMKQRGRNNADVQPLLGELEWVGEVERFVIGRGGVEAPVRIFADEEAIRTILQRWEDDTQAHQRAFASISAYVPQFRDRYAETLSHLRKLKNDDAVYVAAIERLKGIIDAELKRDRPESLQPVLKEYAEKYPRLSGIDAIRADVQRYVELRDNARNRNLALLVAGLRKAQFSTPPFQAQFEELRSGRGFPPPEVVSQYEAVAAAWRGGDAAGAFAGLEKMASGAWGDAASRILERKKALAEQYAALQRAREAGGDYEQALLSFYGSLDRDEDAFFIKATEADVARYRDGSLRRAQQLMSQAEAQWSRYRANGGIEGRQRLEALGSGPFRAQAQLLSQAQQQAAEAIRIHRQLRTEASADWSRLGAQIDAEAQAQRRSLLELRHVLEPGDLKAKLALLGGPDQ